MRGDDNMDKNMIKRYMKDERELRKKHIDLKLYLFGLFVFFLVLMSCIFAFAEPGSDGATYGILFPYLIMENIAFSSLCDSLYCVTEKNRLQSVFVKMLYVPRNMKHILMAKALIMIKDMGIVVIIMQLITVFIDILYNGGKFVVYVETFAPLYIGVICMVVQLTALWINYRAAVKEEL